MDDMDLEKEPVEAYDAQVDTLKETVKRLKKLKKRKEKIRELEKEKNDILKQLEKRHR